MGRFSELPLRRQLFLAILALLIPLFAAVTWSGWLSLQERSHELADQAQTMARSVAAFVDRDLGELDTLGRQFSQVPAVVALDASATRGLFERAMSPRSAVLRLELASAVGQEITAFDAGELEADAGRWAATALAGKDRTLIPMVSGRRLQYVILGYPIRDEQKRTVGALGMFVNLQSLHGAFDSVSLAKGSVVTVTAMDGRILARSVDANRFVGSIDPGAPRRGPTAPHRAVGIDGIERVYAESEANVGPWIVSVGLPMSIAFARATSLWSRSLVILFGAVSSWLLIALILSKRMVEAVGYLDATAQRIASGDFGPIHRRRMFSLEFAELQTAFEAMLRRFNATREQLDTQMAEERRMREELESLQGQVIRQERLAAVGQLVSGVAHEINNPLQSISGFAELLRLQRNLPESAQNDLDIILRESARANAIIRNLALFARQQPGPAALIQLSAVIAAVAELRQRRLESEQIELHIENNSRQPVLAVLTELQQVVLNFVINAEQAILASGRIPARVTIRTHDRDSRVVLEVEDTGPGVKPEDEPRLFEPFFTTKPVGQGTGLGLSISYGIIESLGGKVAYRPAPAGGAIFYFELPADGRA
ncbi:MAG TPA: ATP-binding protein [Vicinamibacterales bacterium]|jgi:C4-dicarboxylate-specific signal transduction histidine kinase|nr:ATP-binding protein [Vicinamibacterales bacterium]